MAFRSLPYLLDEFGPVPGADLAVPCAQQDGVGGEQTEDGTFMSCRGQAGLRTGPEPNF